MIVNTKRRLFNIYEYERMGELGILDEDERVELIQGEILLNDESYPPNHRKFTVDEYERMIEAGILTKDDHVELIEGEIVAMSPIGHRHAACVIRLTRLLTLALGDKAIVSVQNPIRLPDTSEPQPDVAILRPRLDYYASSLATPEDILLLIEVAETSTRHDRNVKMSIYARANIPEVWLTELSAERISQYAKPLNGKYTEVKQAQRGDSLTSRSLPTLTLQVNDILGEQS